MKKLCGIRNLIVGEMALAAVAVCLLPGVLTGCGDDEPADTGNAAIVQSSPEAEVKPGVTGPETKPNRTAADPGPPASSKPDTKPDRQSEPGKIPPGLAETRIAGIGQGLPGQIGMMVSGPGGPGTPILVGDLTIGPAMSTINLPLAERVLEDGNGPSGIGEQARGQIKEAISRSDTDAATALLARLESDHGGSAGAWKAVRQTMRVGGDSPGVTSAPGGEGSAVSGQAEWPLGAQSRYMAALVGGCRGDAAARKFLLAQMAPAGVREGFGLGSIGSNARWINGTGRGPNGKFLARQTGVFQTAGGPVVVAMIARPMNGDPKTGKEMLTEITDRLVARLENQALVKSPCPATGGPKG